MSKVKLYIAISLDGKIAKPGDDVSWLDEIPNPDQSDYGYYAFYDRIQTVIMGNATYKFVQNMGIEYPYKGKTSYVVTRDTSLTDNEEVQFVSGTAIIDLVQSFKNKGAGEGDVWVVGGGQLNTLMLNANLIDELMIYVMPIVIGEGIPLFGKGLDQKMLTLKSSQVFKSGVTELIYNIS
jgi:dihydrofolate reductase